MKRVTWAAALSLLLAAGWLARGQLFPSETAQVNRMLKQLAQDVSFGPDEGNIPAIRRISRAMDRFAPDASIQVELLGVGTFHLSGREEIRERLLAARRFAKRLELRFVDPIIRIGEGATTADVNITATADAEGVRRNTGGFEALEFAFKLRKSDGRWLVQEVVTVPTLKQ